MTVADDGQYVGILIGSVGNGVFNYAADPGGNHNFVYNKGSFLNFRHNVTG